MRRLRLLARRLTQDWEPDGKITEADRDAAREAVYASLALYHACDTPETLGEEFPDLAKRVFTEPGTGARPHRRSAARCPKSTARSMP